MYFWFVLSSLLEMGRELKRCYSFSWVHSRAHFLTLTTSILSIWGILILQYSSVNAGHVLWCGWSMNPFSGEVTSKTVEFTDLENYFQITHSFLAKQNKTKKHMHTKLFLWEFTIFTKPVGFSFSLVGFVVHP